LASVRTGAWRQGEAALDAYIDVNYYRDIARISERGCLDAIFLADGPRCRRTWPRNPAGAWNRPCCSPQWPPPPSALA
jgi:hypothetical protein